MTQEASLFGLTGKKALIVGGGQGMGESSALFLARAGCDVALVDLVAERAEHVAGIVEGIGTKGVSVIGDVMDDAQIPRIVAEAEQIAADMPWADQEPTEVWPILHESGETI